MKPKWDYQNDIHNLKWNCITNMDHIFQYYHNGERANVLRIPFSLFSFSVSLFSPFYFRSSLKNLSHSPLLFSLGPLIWSKEPTYSRKGELNYGDRERIMAVWAWSIILGGIIPTIARSTTTNREEIVERGNRGVGEGKRNWERERERAW